MKFFYFILESLLKELLNINHFTLKSILIKFIPSRINYTHTEPNTLLVDVSLYMMGTLYLFASANV